MIRLINTTTRLPVDKDLEASFFKIIVPSFKTAILKRYDEYHLDVFFVCKDDPDLDLRRRESNDSDKIPDMDLLGVYFTHHPDYHRPVIKICPELIMETCQSLIVKGWAKQSFELLYPTILHSVIIHELAHSLMDHEVYESEVSWRWLAKHIDPKVVYKYSCNCPYHRDISKDLRKSKRIVEESLANAFVLKQRFNESQLVDLVSFMLHQPNGYSAGPNWKAPLPKLLDTASSWGNFKHRILYRPHLKLALENTADPVSVEGNPLEVLVDHLLRRKDINDSSYDFNRLFFVYLKDNLDRWLIAYAQYQILGREFLNGPFGVLSTLSSLSISDPKNRLKYLRNWAGNGSAEAVDILNKLESDLLAPGMKTEALEFQKLRQANHPLRKSLNSYWHNYYSKEIEQSIADLTL